MPQIKHYTKTVVLISGGFDPCHSGHLRYIAAAKTLGDILIVAVNSDEWLIRKKGRAFMPIEERTAILSAMKDVDFVITFDDSDNTAKNAISMVRKSHPYDRIIFANGGDRTKENIPEMDCVEGNIEFVFGVGGEDKSNSSSWILEEWKAPKTERVWGYYRVLHEVPGMKVKELTVNPGCKLSMQRHSKRNEHWIVSEGQGEVVLGGFDLSSVQDSVYLTAHSTIDIMAGEWHQLTNPFDEPLKVVEVQYGAYCGENDIERALE